jgi:putative hemolysin
MIAYLVIVALLIAVLALVSYVEGVYAEMGKFLSREFQENIDAFEQDVEPRLGASRSRVSLSMSVLAQVCTAAIAMLLAWDVFHYGYWTIGQAVQAAVVMLLIIVLVNRLVPYVLFTRTKGRWLVHYRWPLRLLIFLALPVTLMLGFGRSVAALTKEHPPEEPERPSEAVDALIEAGREEGILEESDRQLIQSVVEFGDKTVHEVMTPRPEIFAVEAGTTVERFTELIREYGYSRVPVYEGTIDNIRGSVFVHDILQVPDAEAKTRTVADLMRPLPFVPETQRVSALLKEMQRDNQHMAMVVDEYGSVAGVVTIEDMVEEIVGEIRDEHDEEADVVREAENSYLVPGNLDVDRLDELFGVRVEETGSATLSGFLADVLGHIPAKGEVIERDGLRFEILQSSNVRVERVRVSHAAAPEPQRKRA